MLAWCEDLLELLFPPTCAACGGVADVLFCGSCRAQVEPAANIVVPGAYQTRAVFAYAGPIRAAIQALKYQDRADLGRLLGQSMRSTFDLFDRVDVVVPMPCAKMRLAKRGYNQVRELLRGLDVPARLALEAVHDRPSQVGQDAKARFVNLEGVFQANTNVIRGRHVLLVDDVFTTGATARAAVLALQKAQAACISFLALAATG